MFFAANRTGDASATAVRSGKRAGLRTAVVAVAASAAVAVPAVAAVAAPAHAASPAKPAAAAGAQGQGDKKVKIANHYTLAWNAKKGTATIQDPDGETVGVLSANHPGPITSDFGDQGRTTYTMDAAMSSATVDVNHNGKVTSYDFLRA
ncbi:hypothetical protein ADK70_20505 [Streptomyces rimosus subsp. pseudoverticillatus]|uniref:hypothetical protein n=1 Tax=Streptomyces rimosus TaxID=1927 RepID=UPI0006B26413|nr:hypothetical protein [Streptomyces rimosus]KOT86373.1 hypothetical protein ADK70_20505 [Streptomyces rimosus subsp. pseudoverticillatus]